jgi:hypothetical protein
MAEYVVGERQYCLPFIWKEISCTVNESSRNAILPLHDGSRNPLDYCYGTLLRRLLAPLSYIGFIEL